MGNESSKGGARSGSRGRGSNPNSKHGGGSNQNNKEKHVHISQANIQPDPLNPGKVKPIKATESANSFAGDKKTIKGHYNNKRNMSNTNNVMITDALGDVRLNYHIEAKELGHGHYGVVRKCMHRESCNWYAIKSIRKAKVSKIEVLKREIEILKEVKHPHIIELIEVYEDERYLHLITELCTGGELFDRIIAKTQSKEGHFSEHDAAKLVRDILDAIRYCHDNKGIVHRDLKPENFLFQNEADSAPIKIIDFGLSRHDDAVSGIMQTKVGTPYYVAPEVLRREYTKSCDIWSIGVITYILLCGYPPFYGDSDTQIFESVKIGRFDFPSPEWDDISQSAKDFVIALLKKNPKDRPTAAVALQHTWLTEQLGAEQEDAQKKALRIKSSRRTQNFQKYLAMKKLKKAALGYIASNMTQAEVGALEDAFKAMDKNHTGRITLSDLDEAIEKGSFGAELSQDLRALRNDLSLNDDTEMNYRDFLAATIDRSLAMREDNVKRAFDHFHRHAKESNYLTQEDLLEIFGADAHARDIMEFLDHDGDGKVSFEDFKHAIAESLEDEEESPKNTDE